MYNVAVIDKKLIIHLLSDWEAYDVENILRRNGQLSIANVDSVSRTPACSKSFNSLSIMDMLNWEAHIVP